MKLQEHSTKELKLPDLEVKVSTIDLLRRLINETLVALAAEMGQRKTQLKPTRDLILAYESLELVGFYVNRSTDNLKFNVMKEMVEDVEATKKLIERTSVK